MFDTDDLMLKAARSLIFDMRDALGMKDGACSSILSNETLSDFRNNKFLLSENMPPYMFKWCTQVNSFLNRYTFQDDLISPTQREDLTNAKFINLQEALAASYSRPRSMRCHEVLRLTRKIVRRILSKVSLDASQDAGRFGTKATVGCPASDAYIDQKLMSHPITGSAAHIQWFKKLVLPNDPLLADIVSRNQLGYKITECLQQINVPKKYNIDRGINPNTLLGSRYTDSLGKLIESALQQEGLNIKRLQSRHQKLVKRASQIDLKHVTPKDLATADLSDASHGFLSHLLNAVLPRKWYQAVMRGVIRQVEVAGRQYRLESIMTMGIGFTFPMQTLLFYSLLLAISTLTGVTGLISVYGDDLIYPVNLHRYVVGIFSDLGFKLNLDKTFVHSHFRESCGSDFFKGVDVRPFSMKGSRADVGNKWQYIAFCYKLVNGLLSRWDYCEIQSTIDLILVEITRIYGEVFLVENHMPKTSGIYVDSIPQEDLQPFCVAPWTWQPQLWSYTYPILSPLIPRRYVQEHDPYYWDTLRINHTRDFSWECVLRLPDIMGTPLFRWHRERTGRRKISSVKVRKGICRAYVAAKAAGDVVRYEVRPAQVQPHRMEYSL